MVINQSVSTVKVQLVFVTMAQESWKKEAGETGVHTTEAPVFCINNCGFFGSRITENMCSKCYRDILKARTVASLVEKNSLVPLSSPPSVAEVTDEGFASVADGRLGGSR
ncbi:hypothetical protein GUJ93_ZPchr0003g17087 [Zizania palustris]|uniref:A20-type domain-containing protein n=1 Tax=Zizania palustris TaxID=103762 RepID=A0A8J5VCY2_ZIZPA|nr:hypothetical protein GUJ93_ZPchr0003g17087 [Zizania palustris]